MAALHFLNSNHYNICINNNTNHNLLVLVLFPHNYKEIIQELSLTNEIYVNNIIKNSEY